MYAVDSYAFIRLHIDGVESGREKYTDIFIVVRHSESKVASALHQFHSPKECVMERKVDSEKKNEINK